MASKAELQAAKSAADGLVKSGVSADEALQYAEKASKSAEKYQLYCAAFKLYAKDGKADEAADIIKTLQAEFVGVPDKDIVSMIEQNAKKLAKDNAELGAALNISKARASASQQLSKAKKDLKKSPNSVELKYLVAESYAILGDWKAALKQFKDAGGTVWQIASDEYSGVISAKTAAFWWDYKPRSKFNADSAFKVHAAELYEKLIKDGELSVLEKATAEKRIEQAEQLGASKPKGEQDKLEKVCNPKGLEHCWQFNGDLKDACVKGSAAVLSGGSRLEKGCVYQPNDFCNIDFGESVLPKDAEAFTIEMWVCPHKLSTEQGTRIFSFGKGQMQRVAAFWLFGKQDALVICNGRTQPNIFRNSTGDFTMNTEYHLAWVFVSKDGKWEVSVYKQDVNTGSTIKKSSHVISNGWSPTAFEHKDNWIGGNYYNDKTSEVSYNEVRIWNRALSEEELTQNAIKFHKVGETMKK